MESEKEVAKEIGVRLAETACPGCGYLLDAAISICERQVPTENDISVCAQCGAINLFNADMTLRTATPEDLLGFQANEPLTWVEIIRAREIVARINAQRTREEHTTPTGENEDAQHACNS